MKFTIFFFVGTAFCMPFDVIQQADTPTYSDDFARNVLYPLAAAAYDPDPQKCTTTAIQGTIKRIFNVSCDLVKADTCLGYSALSPSNKAIAIVFRGTSQTSQLLTEFVEAFEEKVAFNGGKVCKYFYNAFNDIWKAGMKDDVLTMYSQYPDYEIWITGHSLGGSLAAIMADYLVTQIRVDPKKVKLVTFGEPRTGDQDFADSHDLKVPYSFRVIHNHDVVPQLPFENMGYHHHRFEVWYNNSMAKPDYRVCADQEDKKCSDGMLELWEPDHHDYFNIKDRLGWTNAGCPSN